MVSARAGCPVAGDTSTRTRPWKRSLASHSQSRRAQAWTGATLRVWGGEDRGTMPRGQPEIPVQVVTVERQRGVALGDSDHARVGGPVGTLRQRPVHQEPAVRGQPEAASELQLQLPASPVQGPGRLREIAHRMGRLVLGGGQRRQALQSVARGGQRPGARDHHTAAILHHRGEPGASPLPNRSRDLGDVDGRRAGVRHQMHPLDAVQERQWTRPRLGGSDRAAPELGILDQSRRADARLLGPPPTGFRNGRGGSEAAQGQAPPQRRQIVQVHAQ